MQIRPRRQLFPQQRRIRDRLLRRMDRARPDNDNYPIILPCDDACGGEACRRDRGVRLGSRADLVAEEGGLDEGIVLRDTFI